MVKSSSIKHLRVYQTSLQLEDIIHELVKKLPENEVYFLGNELRRSSTAISHHLYAFYRHHNYRLRLQALHLARKEAEGLQKLLLTYQKAGYGPISHIDGFCVSVIKQCWGLIKYYKQQESTQHARASIRASDELVAARA